MPIINNFNDLFMLPEEKNEILEEKLLSIIQNLDREKFSHLIQSDGIYIVEYCIGNAINNFTKDIPYTEIVRSINILTNFKPYITSINFSANYLQVDTIKGTIVAHRFTDVFPEFADEEDFYSDSRERTLP